MNLIGDLNNNNEIVIKVPVLTENQNVLNNNDNTNEVVHRVEDDKETGTFISLGIDIRGLQTIFDSYATKKTFATGFFNLALIATNFSQLKQLLLSNNSVSDLSLIDTFVLVFICISLLLQFIVGVILVFLAKNGEFIEDEKREQLIKSNNLVTLLVLTISIINVVINVFINV